MKALSVVAEVPAQMSDTAVFPVVFRTSAKEQALSASVFKEQLEV